MSLSPPQQERIRRLAAYPFGWTVAAAIVGPVAWWLTGSTILAAAVCLIVSVLWRCIQQLVSLRGELDSTRRELTALQEALLQSQRLEAVGRLTAGIAHDFNNHLTVISSNVELVKRRLDAGQERLIRHADAAMQAVQRAAMLTNRLSSFSRQPTPEPEAVDVGRLLNGLAELLRRTLGHGVALDVVLPDEQWFVWADVNRMENVLLSLAVNARDHVSHGGVLSLVAGNVRLDEVFVAANPGVLPGEYIRIAISDPTLAAAVTNPSRDALAQWQPADDLADAELSMARGFVREVGGCLLRSGSASGPPLLRLFLPRHQPPSPAAAPSRYRREGRPRIMVVEDDNAVRSACVEALRELDYEVLEAPEAMDAFRVIADHGGIDLLFTDVGLPGGVSGRALADAARNVDPGIKVLFTTGYEPSDRQERSDTAMLAKPFSPAQLAAKVRQILSAPVAVGYTETVQG